jgi:hypothetical protein
MRILMLSFLILVACSIRVNPQAGPFDKSCSQPNVPNQLGVVTPPKNIDFKIIVIVPPEKFDRGMVRNWSSGAKQVGPAPQSVVPCKDADPFSKTPPSRIKNRHSR